MALNNLLNSSNVKKPLGSPYAVARVQDANGNVFSTSDKYIFPLIGDSTFNNSVGELTVEDEAGNLTKFDGTTERTFDVTFIQSDVSSLDIVNELAGKNLTIVKEVSLDADSGGSYPYLVIGTAKVSKNYSKGFKSSELPVTFNITNNTTAKGIDLSLFTAAEFTGDLSAVSLATVEANEGILFTAVA